jgi:peptide/nickel transport system substrate-binding protein
MKRRIIWGLLTFLILISMLLASCGKTTTVAPTTTQSTTTTTTTSTTPVTSTSTTITTTTVTTSTSTTGKWWDSLGTPQYGGTLINRGTQNINSWDPYLGTGGTTGYDIYLECPFTGDYTTDPDIWDFSNSALPWNYITGFMLKSWETPNAYTVIFHLREDVYWQNIAPANGRQLVASDVVFHYNRQLGLGGGYTTPSPYYSAIAAWQPLQSVVATDKFTVTFNWKPGTSQVSILGIMMATGADNSIECPEAVTQWGNLNDWHHAIGTGPYILTDFVGDSSVTYTRNPNYWAHDMRWPQNKLPYIDTVKTLIIANNNTALAAFRVGKLDAYGGVPTANALALMKTNPEIVVKQVPLGTELTLDPRNDVAPFNNLKVRIALQHAINIPLIAQTYYQGYAVPWPASLTQNQMGIGGWGVGYLNWPQSTKDEYTYDPALATKMLADAGFASGIKTTFILQTDADQDLFLIVQSQLAAVNVTYDTTVMDSTSWQAYVLTGRKQMGLCARNQGILGFNFEILRQFMRFGTGPSYGTNYIQVNDTVCQKAYNDYQAVQTIEDARKILNDLNLYVATQHFAISISQPTSFNMVQPWVKGNPGRNTLGNCTFRSPGVIIWIDSAMKTSLGH